MDCTLLWQRQVLYVTDYLFRLESKLSEMENKYGITERWTTADRDYSDARAAHLKEKLQQLKTSMWAVAVRRDDLLRMKAKYAGMSVLCAYVMCLAKALNSWYGVAKRMSTLS